jgi:hypothetical protein
MTDKKGKQEGSSMSIRDSKALFLSTLRTGPDWQENKQLTLTALRYMVISCSSEPLSIYDSKIYGLRDQRKLIVAVA